MTDGSGITVGVVDSGADDATTDLADAVVPGTDLVVPGGDGTIDHDPDLHGTGMAMLIAGRGGDHGLVGVAPGAAILPIAIRLRGGNPVDDYAEGLRFAVDHGAQVINMSVGAIASVREDCPDRVAAAVRYAASRDVVVVAGSGNRVGGPDEYPGSCPGVVTVGAVGPGLELWPDSHRSEYVDVAAPGAEIAAVTGDGRVYDSSGTSNSAALVSGVVALIRAHHPDESAHQVVNRLLTTAQDLGEPGTDTATGHGLVRPYEALTTAAVPPGAPNPIYDGLDLTDTADPGPGPPPLDAPSPPAVAPPPTLGSGDGGTSPLILLPIAAIILAALTATILIVVRTRRP